MKFFTYCNLSILFYYTIVSDCRDSKISVSRFTSAVIFFKSSLKVSTSSKKQHTFNFSLSVYFLEGERNNHFQRDKYLTSCMDGYISTFPCCLLTINLQLLEDILRANKSDTNRYSV